LPVHVPVSRMYWKLDQRGMCWCNMQNFILWSWMGSGGEKAVRFLVSAGSGKERSEGGGQWCCVTCVHSRLLSVNKWGWVGQHGTGLS
jgi:hypothetical protein